MLSLRFSMISLESEWRQFKTKEFWMSQFCFLGQQKLALDFKYYTLEISNDSFPVRRDNRPNDAADVEMKRLQSNLKSPESRFNLRFCAKNKTSNCSKG